jgi:hypothetical protein
MYGRKPDNAKIIHQLLTQFMETGSMLKKKITRKAMDLREGVECKMLSCVWINRNMYLTTILNSEYTKFSTQNIQNYDTKYSVRVYAVEISFLQPLAETH